MSHDRGCPCGRERWEYKDCTKPDCYKKPAAVSPTPAEASKPCPRCGGAGSYMYDENHGRPCEVCCPHDQGRWLMRNHYKDNNGKFACRNCGAHLGRVAPKTFRLIRVVSLLRDLYCADPKTMDQQVMACLRHPNELLGGQAPLDAIRAGDGERVENIFQAMLDCAYL